MSAPAELLAAFENRMAKRHRHLKRWAAREGTDCFRLYDRDIPELPFVADAYGPRLLLQQYTRRDEAEDPAWLEAVAAAAARATGRDRAAVTARVRRRIDRRHEQHERLTEARDEVVVHEAGLAFVVDLARYVDTGLFLDHRPLRARVREAARGRRVLNLFSYTGSLSVSAAAGGATQVCSVDLSNTYLEWAKRNFAANGLPVAAHRFVRAEAFEWLAQAARAGERFDLIVADPPAFSTSKRMREAFDVQRDHGRLLAAALALMDSRGELYFSTNLRDFRFGAGLAGWRVEDIGAASIPEDFRNRRIHGCWRIAAT